MAIKHNKKRNFGMLSEFFAAYIAKNIVENKNNNNTIETIWKKYFLNKRTEIYKEGKLFNALYAKKFTNKEIAFSWLKKVEDAARTKINYKLLEREKTNLLREINNTFNDTKQGNLFFENSIQDYTNLASIQVLLNSWFEEGTKNKFLTEGIINPTFIEIEDKILNLMCQKKEPQKASSNILKKNIGEEVNHLVVKIMKEKINEKFSSKLNQEQKYILDQYVYGDKTNPKLKTTLVNLKTETVKLINEEISKKDVPQKQKEKLLETRKILTEETTDETELNDNNIIFYMNLSLLNEELKSEN